MKVGDKIVQVAGLDRLSGDFTISVVDHSAALARITELESQLAALRRAMQDRNELQAKEFMFNAPRASAIAQRVKGKFVKVPLELMLDDRGNFPVWLAPQIAELDLQLNVAVWTKHGRPVPTGDAIDYRHDEKVAPTVPLIEQTKE